LHFVPWRAIVDAMAQVVELIVLVLLVAFAVDSIRKMGYSARRSGRSAFRADG